MARGEIHDPDYRPHFSGHETFPLRYGWLNKAFEAVAAAKNLEETIALFQSEAAIARFGVGRNMVSAIKHWALATNIIENGKKLGSVRTADFGRLLFGKNGIDPFLENPSSLWAMHWRLASPAERTTWHWAFNYFSPPSFERETLVSGLEALARERGWSRVARGTIKRDVECLLRSYVAKNITASASLDDALESPLIELGLIQPIGKRDGFRLHRGRKPSLSDGVFAYAIADFWGRGTGAATLNFETVAYEPGAPGRVFLLDEDELIARLSDIEETTDGAIRWSETAGLKQLIRSVEAAEFHELRHRYLELDYPVPTAERAA